MPSPKNQTTNERILEELQLLKEGQYALRTDMADMKLSMVTKDDLKNELKNFITKDDLKNELKNFATKDDLKNGLKNGLNSLEARLTRRMDSYQEINIKHHLETKEAVGQLAKRHDLLKEGLANAAR